MNEVFKLDPPSLLAIKRNGFIFRLNKTIELFELSNEEYLFTDENVFRLPSVLDKLQKNPVSIKILERQERKWLKNNKHIYIFIADTLSELKEECPTCKYVKRAISEVLELTTYKILLKNIYEGRTLSEIKDIKDKVELNPQYTVDELVSLKANQEKLNPELNRFLKNWTRSLTFDIKVRISSLMFNLKSTFKKKNSSIEQETKEEVYSTRENMFSDIAEEIMKTALNLTLEEEYKFISARLISKDPESYAKVLFQKRNIKNDEEKKSLYNRLSYLVSLKNTYTYNQYKKYDLMFPKGLKEGLEKLKKLRGIDKDTAEVIFSIFVIETLRQEDDYSAKNMGILKYDQNFYDFIYAVKPKELILSQIYKKERLFNTIESSFVGHDNFIDFAKNVIILSLKPEEERVKKYGKLLNTERKEEQDFLMNLLKTTSSNKKMKLEYIKMLNSILKEAEDLSKLKKNILIRECPLMENIDLKEYKKVFEYIKENLP